MDFHAFNRGIIEEFRANGGKVGGPFEGKPVCIVGCIGAKSGQPRTIPLVYSKDNGRYVIIASKAGMEKNPDWYHNLKAHPEVDFEVGTEKFRVRAEEVYGEERRRLFDAQAAEMEVFKEYEKKAPREIPVFTLTRL